MPYWEYTWDTATYGPHWAASSELFKPDWFGPMPDDDSATHGIEKGVWARQRVLEDARNYSSIVNPCGLRRSPRRRQLLL